MMHQAAPVASSHDEMAAARQRRRGEAERIVSELRADLALAAEAGQLDDERGFGFAITVRHLGARATLRDANALIAFAISLDEEARARQMATRADCANTWAEPHKRSCAETVLAKHEQIIADRLAEQLVTGPWPI